MRKGYEELSTAEWTDEEAMHHLTETFDRACRSWPDLMERYVVDFADAAKENRKEIMRRGLRETIKHRNANGA